MFDDWLMNVITKVGNNWKSLGGGGSGWFGEWLRVGIGMRWIFRLFKIS